MMKIGVRAKAAKGRIKIKGNRKMVNQLRGRTSRAIDKISPPTTPGKMKKLASSLRNDVRQIVKNGQPKGSRIRNLDIPTPKPPEVKLSRRSKLGLLFLGGIGTGGIIAAGYNYNRATRKRK